MPLENFWRPRTADQESIDSDLALDEDFDPNKDTDSCDREFLYPELQNTLKFAESNPDFIYQIYEWYKNAISRRGREPLDEGRFIYHFFEGGNFDESFMYGDIERGYVLGVLKYDVFIPTHFAPKSIRTGYEMIKELSNNEKIPCVMSITDDLVETVSKLPDWQVLDMSILGTFRDSFVDKKIVYNRHPDVKKLMMGLVQEYMNESQSNL